MHQRVGPTATTAAAIRHRWGVAPERRTQLHASHASARWAAPRGSAASFIVTPDLSSTWHVKYVYESPKSLDVVDLNVITLDQGTFASTDIRLLLQVN